MHGCTVMERDIARDQSHSPETYENVRKCAASDKKPRWLA